MQRSSIKILSNLSILLLIAGIASQPVLAQSGASLTIHDIQGTPQSEQFAYDVSVLFSIYESNGDPVRELAPADISLTEDGKRVDPTAVKSADQEPINVAVVMDTSGSMAGTKMEAASQAAAHFLSTLASDDQAALVSFNSEVRTESDFTDDLSAVREKVDLLSAVKESGTCFYDALYETIQLTASIPSGRRAIVILTDGKDELPNGSVCSKYTDQDVIDLATNQTTRVPIYTLGFGNRIDAKGLERIASRTGGMYQYAADASQLNEVFGKLAKQVRSQYRLTYISIAPPGPHVLVVKVDTNTIHDQGTRDFILPPFPYRIVFISPIDGDEIGAETTLSVQVRGQGEPIARVEFFANGESLGVVNSSPYQLVWKPSFDVSQTKLEAAAYGEAGGELARSSISVSLKEGATPPTEVVPPTVFPNSPKLTITSIILIGAVIAVIAVVVIVVIVVSSRRKRHDQERDNEWIKKVQGEEFSTASMGEERTIDSFTPSDYALGMLVVLQSDDPVMTGQRIEISKSITNLGRKADNDVIFAKDSPVSRHHAVIEQRGNGLFLSEVMSMEDGTPKRPAYGTFVNGNQIEESVLLHDGDEIRLGKRVRLRFEGLQQTYTDDGRTMDQFNISEDKTMDSGE